MKWFEPYNFNDEFRWTNYYSLLDKYGIIGYLEEILKDIDITKGFAIVDSFSYLENVSNYWRTLNKLNNCFIYNKYFQKLIERDEANREIERLREEQRRNKVIKDNNKQKRAKKRKNPRINVSTSRDIFDNSIVYIVDNLDDGTSKVTKTNPLENQRDYTDLKGIKFNFNKFKKK